MEMGSFFLGQKEKKPDQTKPAEVIPVGGMPSRNGKARMVSPDSWGLRVIFVHQILGPRQSRLQLIGELRVQIQIHGF